MAEDMICASCGPNRPCQHELAASTDPTPRDPTTEAGRRLLAQFAATPADEWIEKSILAIEAAARDEGRRDAVRALQSERAGWFPCTCIPAYKDRGLEAPDCPAHDIDRWLNERVAGLNASESPPTGYGWHNDGDQCIGPDCINMEHDDVGDASESGQPPETDRDTPLCAWIDHLWNEKGRCSKCGVLR